VPFLSNSQLIFLFQFSLVESVQIDLSSYRITDGAVSFWYSPCAGLKRLIVVAPASEIERLAPRLALRVRPFFEYQDAQVRQLAVALLADLLRTGSATLARHSLADQVRSIQPF